MEKLKVLVVDDSVLYRKILSDILSGFSEVEVVGAAPTGKLALSKIRLNPPDFVTLDFEMPDMNGIETLKELKKIAPETKAVMVSAHTQAGAQVTMQALEEGAFDFIAKPSSNNLAENKRILAQQLKPIINIMLIKKRLNGLAVKPSALKPRPVPERIPSSSSVATRMSAISGKGRSIIQHAGKVDIVALGISTGGPSALTHVLPRLPANFKVPIVIVQHMPPVFTGALADSLNKKSSITVVEAQDGMLLESATAYIAPGGKMMKIEDAGGGNTVIIITDAPPENNCKPAADYLFRSVAQCYRKNSLGVIMTGMGSDGTKGLLVMKKLGAKVIAQDEQSCTVFGMPMEAIKAGVVDIVAPLDNIADEIMASVK